MPDEKKTVDARGLFCPGPLQVLKGVLRHIDSGETLVLLADDPESKKDIKAWCEAEGHNLKSVKEKEGTITFLVIKK